MTFSSDGAYQCAGQHNQLGATVAERGGGGKLWQMPMAMAMAKVVAKVGIDSARGQRIGAATASLVRAAAFHCHAATTRQQQQQQVATATTSSGSNCNNWRMSLKPKGSCQRSFVWPSSTSPSPSMLSLSWGLPSLAWHNCEMCNCCNNNSNNW